MNPASEAPFLRAHWRRLVLLNYRIDPAVLQRYLPAHTELDIWQGTCYASLVGFMFQHTRVLGWAVPFHVHFEEINLRFYVKRHDPVAGWKRGVVFVREIVPKPAITWVANTLYRERYVTRRMWHRWDEQPGRLEVEYAWREAGRWQSFGVQAQGLAQEMKVGSEAEFITEHYWGYARRDAGSSTEYQVEHPRWQVYPVEAWHADVDFARVYGPPFAALNASDPVSIFLAEGSEVLVRKGRLLKG